MRLIAAAVFEALVRLDRACSHAEIEREADLTRDEVREGLDGLRRRGLLRMFGLPRQRATYCLVPGAMAPLDLRGRYERSQETRERARQHRRAACPELYQPTPDYRARPIYSAAADHTPKHAAGSSRAVKSALGACGDRASFSHCELAIVWRNPKCEK